MQVFQKIKQHVRIKEAGVREACLGNSICTNLDEIKSAKR